MICAIAAPMWQAEPWVLRTSEDMSLSFELPAEWITKPATPKGLSELREYTPVAEDIVNVLTSGLRYSPIMVGIKVDGTSQTAKSYNSLTVVPLRLSDPPIIFGSFAWKRKWTPSTVFVLTNYQNLFAFDRGSTFEKLVDLVIIEYPTKTRRLIFTFGFYALTANSHTDFVNRFIDSVKAE
jgi:hypothetical protein